MRRVSTLCVLIIMLECGVQWSPVAAQETPVVKIESLSWLAGTWASTEDGRETEEHWMSAKAGLMLGMNRTINKQSRASFEFLRIAQETAEGEDPRLVYYASPGGQPAVPFRLIKSGEQSVVFQNLENDFPQRIIYKREGDKLTARIEGTVDGKERSIEWHWNRTATLPDI